MVTPSMEVNELIPGESEREGKGRGLEQTPREQHDLRAHVEEGPAEDIGFLGGSVMNGAPLINAQGPIYTRS